MMRVKKGVAAGIVASLGAVGGAVQAGATDEVSYRTYTLKVLTNAQLAPLPDNALAEDIVEVISPFREESVCPGVAFMPAVSISRFDQAGKSSWALEHDLSELETEAAKSLNAVEKMFNKRPSYEQVRAVAMSRIRAQPAGEVLSSESAGKGDVGPFLAVEKQVFLIPPPGEDAAAVKERLSETATKAKIIPVSGAKAFHKETARKLCKTADSSESDGTVAVLFHPQIEEQPPRNQNTQAEPMADSLGYVRQGLTYVSLAKGARGPQERQENYRNAEASFTAAIDAGNRRGVCYANAHMNRGLVYALQDKPSLALRDLEKAVDCDPEDATTRYNLAAVHSLAGNRDLSLEALDGALQRGFSDCDALRDDPDLKNVRKMPEYKRTLEKHKLFCF